MRTVVPLILIAAVAGCTVGPPVEPAPLTAQQQSRLTDLLSGKVAGAPQTCLSNWRMHDMVVINDSTIIFRDNAGRTWLQKPQNPCDRLGSPQYALVTRSSLNQLCRGDLAQVLDTMGNITVGSCVLGDFVPYTRVGA